MKKIVKLSMAILVSLALTGCGDKKAQTNSKELITECVRTATIQEGVSVNLNYKVISKDGIVAKIETVEVVTSDDKSVLENFKKSAENTYSPYKDVKYYDYDITIDKNVLTSKTAIDYENIDTDKLIEIDSANGQLIKNGKVKLDDVTNLYSSIGATCTNK